MANLAGLAGLQRGGRQNNKRLEEMRDGVFLFHGQNMQIRSTKEIPSLCCWIKIQVDNLCNVKQARKFWCMIRSTFWGFSIWKKAPLSIDLYDSIKNVSTKALSFWLSRLRKNSNNPDFRQIWHAFRKKFLSHTFNGFKKAAAAAAVTFLFQI